MKHVIFVLALLLGMAAVAADQTLVEFESDVQVKLSTVMDCTHAVTTINTSVAGNILGKFIAVRRAVSAVNNNQLEPLIAIVISKASDKNYDVLNSEEYGAVKEALSHIGEFSRFGLCDEKRAVFYKSLEVLLQKTVASQRK